MSCIHVNPQIWKALLLGPGERHVEVLHAVAGGGVVVVQEASSARFGARKTGSGTWQLYRLM